MGLSSPSTFCALNAGFRTALRTGEPRFKWTGAGSERAFDLLAARYY
jgi:hypothetical protein